MAATFPRYHTIGFFPVRLCKGFRLPNQSQRRYSDLQQRIIEALDTVTVVTLARTWLEIEYRLDILRATDGAHAEVY